MSWADPSSVRPGLQLERWHIRGHPSSFFPSLSQGKVFFSVYVGQFLNCRLVLWGQIRDQGCTRRKQRVGWWRRSRKLEKEAVFVAEHIQVGSFCCNIGIGDPKCCC